MLYKCFPKKEKKGNYVKYILWGQVILKPKEDSCEIKLQVNITH